MPTPKALHDSNVDSQGQLPQLRLDNRTKAGHETLRLTASPNRLSPPAIVQRGEQTPGFDMIRLDPGRATEALAKDTPHTQEPGN